MFGFFFVAFVAVFGIVFFISYKLLEDREDTDSDWSSSQSQEPDYFQQTQNAPWELKYNKGKQGEYQLGQVLNQLYGYKKILYNLYIFKEDGTTTEIDALLIHPSGIYIFESKNYKGWIFGSENQQYWTQVLSGGRGKSYKHSFFNPIIQNKVHLKWLNYYLNQYTPNLYSYIVFGNDCQLKEIHLNSDRHKVIQTWQVIGTIDRQACQSQVYLSPEQIDDLYRMLLPLTKRKQAIKERHINSIAQQKQRREAEKICPRCQHGLVLRTASKGSKAGQKFWGCSNFPRCRFTQKYQEQVCSPPAAQIPNFGQPVVQNLNQTQSNS